MLILLAVLFFLFYNVLRPFPSECAFRFAALFSENWCYQLKNLKKTICSFELLILITYYDTSHLTESLLRP